MKLKIKNLGRIKDADIEIKPLTVFIGENGTNKTWAAYALHSLLRSTVRRPSKHLGVQVEPTERISDVVRDVLRKWHDSKADQFVADLNFEAPHSNGQEIGAAELALGIGLPATATPGARAELSWEASELPAATKGVRLTLRDAGHWIGIEPRTQGGIPASSRTLTTREAPEVAIGRELARSAHETANDVFVLHAERKSVNVGAGEPGTAPFAHLDYAEMMQRLRSAADRTDVWELSRLWSILGGELRLANANSDLASSRFHVATGDSLPLHAAHSLVRAVEGLWAFLLKVAQPGDFLIIDELEMNAHPHAQLQLTEFIAMLVNKGLRVVFTTHSPYIVDHLNNLMEASQVTDEKKRAKLAQKFLLKTEEAFIVPEKVAVHWFKPTDADDPTSEVKVRPVVKKGLIDATTFGEWTDRESSLFNEVLRARG